ncbi:MAG: zinc ABC transporter substrate-binding protein [Thermoproteota archaeon]|nr:metal ABC transporter substrate-binding protein [Candidatus Brockarchaeota archaeon]
MLQSLKFNTVITVASIIIAGIFESSVFTQQVGGVRILVTMNILKLLVSPIVGDRGEVVSIVPEGVEPHSFTLNPSVILAALNSDLIVITGHMEWERELVERVAEEKGVSPDSISINLLELVKNNGTILKINGEENVHGFWLLPDNAVLIAKSLEDMLSKIKPEYSEEFSSNYVSFTSRVSSLKGFFKRLSEKYGSENSVVIGFYAEQYVVEALGLKVGAVLVGEEEIIRPYSLSRIYEGLKSGEYACIVVSDTALLMSNVKNTIKQISTDTGCSIAYISVVSTSGLENYDSLMYYDAGQVYSALLSSHKPVSTGLDIYFLTTITALLVITIETLIIVRRVKR